MIITGIVGEKNKTRTENVIKTFFNSLGKNVAVIDFVEVLNMSKEDYFFPLEENRAVSIDFRECCMCEISSLIAPYKRSIKINGINRTGVFTKYLQYLDDLDVDILIFKINFSDVEREFFKFFKFDIIIYSDKVDYLKERDEKENKILTQKTLDLLKDEGIALVNVDNRDFIGLLNGLKNYIVTFGFNSKASITMSSVGDAVVGNEFLCCLQRTIYAKNGLKIEPQEYLIRLGDNDFSPYDILAATTFAIVTGMDINRKSSFSERYEAVQ